eukprot:5240244-Pyramimonas_sp.AAC.1
MHTDGHPIPLINHYDGVVMFRNTEIDVVSFSSVMVHDKGISIFDKKFPLCILKHKAVPDILAKSMAFEQEVLLSSKHPCEGFYGEALKRAHTAKPLGVRACLLGWHGDFKARKE